MSDDRYGEDWEGAICAQVGAEVADGMFFATDRTRVAQAVALCWECPLRAICARTSLEEEAQTPVDMRFGIRGGLTPEQRARLQPNRICPDCGSPIVTRAKHCEDDQVEHLRTYHRDYRRERRAA
ncbi:MULTISPECIES: WhiB family transcriptional regulator [unclassified Brevibacterium]|uniref:WhiB family transcriptional regulator n=1 Tax=unclassified Brevibacterium TaxID=2614124 RepID=UPI001E48262C|nr:MULTISPECIES: WhiB family transcriptional regulator [unclassified Brevibacterium]MCD1287304.1 hypothetical protein [Brevibacterium sp. CCUG 69071]MDK8436440.1 WhiB family transcriptional regulator [Brevibacterium sp. H-BE7]